MIPQHAMTDDPAAHAGSGTARPSPADRVRAFLDLPRPLLDRVRWLFLLLLLLGLGLTAPELAGASTQVWPHQVAASLALAATVAWALWSYHRGDAGWALDTVPVAGLVVTAAALHQPDLVAAQALPLVYFRSLFGGRARAGVNALLFSATYVVAVAVEEGDVATVRVLSVVASILVTAIVVQEVAHLLADNERRTRRQSVLTEVAAQLLVARTQDEVGTIVATAATALGLDPRASGACCTLDDDRARLWRHDRDRAADLAPGAVPDALRRACTTEAPLVLDGADAASVATWLDAGEADTVVVAPLSVGPRRGTVLVARAGADGALPAALQRLAVDARFAFERAALTTELQHNEELLRGVVDNSSDVIATLGSTGHVRFVSPAVEAVLGRPPQELIGTAITDLLHPEDIATVARALDEPDRPAWTAGVELRLRHADGSWRTAEVVANELSGAERSGYVVNVRDVTHRKQLEAEIAFRAYHDPLTQLANRTRLMDRLAEAIDRSARSGEPFGVALLDLDDFKAVNDNLGHRTGDRLLVEVARRLRSGLRGTDAVARLGGDEFALLLEDVTDVDAATEVVQRLLTTLHQPLTLGEQRIVPRASAGLVVSTGRENGVQEILRNADIAMYAAKLGGKGHCAVFDPSMRAAALDRLELRADLERAVQRGQLSLHYQPLVELAGDRPVGFEALLRWDHPERGRVFPDVFIPLAEETRLIIPIGRWVLREACAQAARWGDDIHVAVNVSSVQLEDPQLLDHVRDALDAAGLAAHRLTIELTETALMRDTDQAITVLKALAELGVTIAVDDFGTGYSSFNYLNRFPLNVLKIDRSFVDVVLAGPEDAAIAKAIVRLGQALELQVVAEGIETAAQRDTLRGWGCRLGQGYHFSPPMPADVAERWLAAALERDAVAPSA